MKRIHPIPISLFLERRLEIISFRQPQAKRRLAAVPQPCLRPRFSSSDVTSPSADGTPWREFARTTNLATVSSLPRGMPRAVNCSLTYPRNSFTSSSFSKSATRSPHLPPPRVGAPSTLRCPAPRDAKMAQIDPDPGRRDQKCLSGATRRNAERLADWRPILEIDGCLGAWSNTHVLSDPGGNGDLAALRRPHRSRRRQ